MREDKESVPLPRKRGRFASMHELPSRGIFSETGLPILRFSKTRRCRKRGPGLRSPVLFVQKEPYA
jgi:hypothetical protein